MQNETNSNEGTMSNYLTPIAIVAAGILIAGAMYFSGGKTPDQSDQNLPSKPVSLLEQMTPISAEDHIQGNPNAPVVIVEYSDTECPFCKRFQLTMQGVIEKLGKEGKVAWVYRHFPLDSLHPKTRKEAEATECANELGGNTTFWKYIDLVYASTPANNGLDPAKLPEFAKTVGLDAVKFTECLSSGKYATKVEANLQDGIKIGIQGTPFSVLVLKDNLSADKKKLLDEYAVTNKLYDQEGKPLVYVSNDNKKVAMSGALPQPMIESIVGVILK